MILIEMGQLTFLTPVMLLWLLAIPVALWVLKKRGRAVFYFSPFRFVQVHSTKSWAAKLAANFPVILNVLGISLLIGALARPVLLKKEPLVAKGADMIICLDTSSSMTTKEPNQSETRLESTISAARDFILGRPDDRIGLVKFARYADLQCPLTFDHSALVKSLENTEPVRANGPEDATGIGGAIAKATSFLRSRGNEGLIILLTDGVENVATSATPDEIAPIHAGQIAKEQGVRVHTLAAGQGKIDDSGQWVSLDTTQIRRVSELTGGQFFQEGEELGLRSIFQEIDRLEKTRFEKPRYRTLECFLPILVVGTLLIGMSYFLRSSWLEVAP